MPPSSFIDNRQQQKMSCQSFPVPPPPPPPPPTQTGAQPGTAAVATATSAVATFNPPTSAPRTVQAGGGGNRLLRHQAPSDFLKIGAVWLDRYEITDIKGKGTFGQVFRAHDRKTHEEVAIKVIKNRRQFLAQAEIEITLLREIAHFQENEQRAAEVGANYVGKCDCFV